MVSCQTFQFLGLKNMLDLECNSQIDPDQGCRGFHQTDGGEDQWYSTKRCTDDPSVSCQINEDCSYLGLGRCDYVPGTGGNQPRIRRDE